MNDLLLRLYMSKWENLCSEMRSINFEATCPLLLKIDNEDEFENADIRVMFFGQETNSWYRIFHDDLTDIIGYYNQFYNKNECWKYGGQFWNGLNRFRNLLEKRYPNKKIRLVWNNIVKIGRYNCKGFPPEQIYQIERTHFSVIREEIKIIKPNIVLFLTGPYYDRILVNNFDEIQKEPLDGFKERQLSKISIENVDYTFRTYHPNFLWRNKIDNYFEAIIREINL